MRLRFLSTAFIATSFAIFAAFPIHSQMHPVCSSLDQSIARADQVVVGRIIDFGTATYDKSGRAYQQPFVLAVEETLKGADVQQLSLDLGLVTWSTRTWPPMSHFDWNLPFSHGDDSLIHSHRLLIAQRFSEPPYPPHSDVFDLDSGGLSVATADLTGPHKTRGHHPGSEGRYPPDSYEGQAGRFLPHGCRRRSVRSKGPHTTGARLFLFR